MDEELERLVIRVRADTGAFARDVQAMRGALDGPLEAGAERAGRAVEGALARAVRTGKLGFEDLRRVALSVLAEIAAASVRDGLGAVLGGGGGGIAGVLGGLLGGAPGGAPPEAAAAAGPAGFDTSKYMEAMGGVLQNPQFMEMAEKLGQQIMQVRKSGGSWHRTTLCWHM